MFRFLKYFPNFSNKRLKWKSRAFENNCFMEQNVVKFHFLLRETWFLFKSMHDYVACWASIPAWTFFFIILTHSSSRFPAVIEINWEFLKYSWKKKKIRVLLIWKKNCSTALLVFPHVIHPAVLDMCLRYLVSCVSTCGLISYLLLSVMYQHFL